MYVNTWLIVDLTNTHIDLELVIIEFHKLPKLAWLIYPISAQLRQVIRWEHLIAIHLGSRYILVINSFRLAAGPDHLPVE
jgi:hypothetical protein